MFDISSLQYNSENPTLLAVGFTVICALILGTMIAFTYEKTSRDVERPDHFLQAMVLVTIVAAMIIQAIGDSVARGLGMLGALSIIRFRTTVRDPRNIVFMFGAIAVGIACGVFGFLIAICGTVGFCMTAFILRFSSFNRSNPLLGTLRIDIPSSYDGLHNVKEIITKFSLRQKLVAYKIYTGEKKYGLTMFEYKLKLTDQESGNQLLEAIRDFEDVKVLDLDFKERNFDNI